MDIPEFTKKKWILVFFLEKNDPTPLVNHS